MEKTPREMIFKPKKITFGEQMFHMQKDFPGFKLHKVSNEYYWIGNLQPTQTSQIYTVKIVYSDDYPKVFVTYPKLLGNTPHIYKDKSLCLFYPDDNSFNNRSLISETIIEWTVHWLFCYEAWLKEGVWWGDEAPHYASKSVRKKHSLNGIY